MLRYHSSKGAAIVCGVTTVFARKTETNRIASVTALRSKGHYDDITLVKVQVNGPFTTGLDNQVAWRPVFSWMMKDQQKRRPSYTQQKEAKCLRATEQASSKQQRLCEYDTFAVATSLDDSVEKLNGINKHNQETKANNNPTIPKTTATTQPAKATKTTQTAKNLHQNQTQQPKLW